MTRGRTAVAVLTLLAVAACSSTTEPRDATSTGAVTDGTSAPGAARTDATAGPTATGAPTRRVTTSRPASEEAAPKTSVRRPDIPVGKGITDRTITIGVSVSPGDTTNAALTALGFQGAESGDERSAVEAIVAYLNARGGMAGRKIVPVYRNFDPNGNYNAEYARDCAAFTEDATTFAVVASMSVPGWEALTSCLAKRKVLHVLNQIDVVDQPVFARYAPYLYSPSQLRGDRWGLLVDKLAAAKFFGPGAKVGVIRVDTAATKRVLERTIVPRLAKHGLTGTESATYPAFYSTGDLGAVAAQMQNIALRFKSADVTHVMFLSSSGTGSYLFTPIAESLSFRPRYGFFSTDGPQTLTANTPKEQLRRSLLVGWWPAMDVDWGQDPKDAKGQVLCHTILKKAGVATPSRLSFQEFSYYCDELFFLKATLDRADALTPPGVRAVADRLGTSFVPGQTYRTFFSPTRFDGVDAVRMGAYDEACNCFRYKGGWLSAR